MSVVSEGPASSKENERVLINAPALRHQSRKASVLGACPTNTKAIGAYMEASYSSYTLLGLRQPTRSKPSPGGRDRAMLFTRTHQNDASAFLGSRVLFSHKVTELAKYSTHSIHASVLRWWDSKCVAVSTILSHDMQYTEWPTRRLAEFPNLGAAWLWHLFRRNEAG